MTIDELKKNLMNGTWLVFAKQLNAEREVRACYALVFDRRHGFHVMEKNLKQIRTAMAENGIMLGVIKEKGVVPLPAFPEPVTELPEEQEEETYQKLPRRDFTMEVLERKLFKKIGFF